MKKLVKLLLCVLSIVMLFSVTACGDNECSHSYTSSVTKAATCKDTGVKTYTCNVCGDSYTEEIAKLTTHSYTSKVTKEATCKEMGVITYTCDVCGDSYTNAINKTNNHTWIDANCIHPKTCKTCEATSGNIDVFAHTGANECKNCGINYFEKLSNHIKLYGENSGNKATISYDVWISGKLYLILLRYDFDADKLEIECNSNPGNGYTGISIDILRNSSNITYLYLDLVSPVSDLMKGSFIASEITKNTTSLPYDSFSSFKNVHTEAYMQANAAKHLKILLTAVNEIMIDIDINLGTKHFGFTNYPSNGD